MNKDQIEKSLRRIIPSAKLTSKIDFEISDGCLTITISKDGVIANMQDNESAFEGWIVVIRAAFPNVKKVILDWIDPVDENLAHYKRFVMRAANFRKGYEWFDVSERHKVEVDDMQKKLESKTLIVNFPKTEKESDDNKEKKSENLLERKLVKLWSKTNTITDRQLPVGLFKGTISDKFAYTPGDQSEIDLWQLDDRTMHIYELKTEKNKKIGIISELMFYVCTIQNIVDGFIKYPDLTKEKSFRHLKDFANAVENNNIDTVKGYFTAVKLHTLIESPKLKDTIKDILNDNTFGIVFDYKDISDINF